MYEAKARDEMIPVMGVISVRMGKEWEGYL